VYDAIIVGARCAGSPTAMLLANKGYRVLLVDRSTFPSDMAMSTHLVWQAGTARLQRWDLLDRVRSSNCPPLTTCHLDLGPFTLSGIPCPADGVAQAYAPRRTVLDQLLVDGAVRAGAELREGFAVDEILADGECVTGIRGSEPGGSTLVERTRIVIGADGMHSLVARSVQAPEYNTKPPLQGTYFTYWSGVPIDGIRLYPRDYRQVYCWMTNDNVALIGVNWTGGDFPAVRSDVEGNYLAALESCAPELAERMREGRREERWIGGATRNFFRTPFGDGWALVGDAGWTVDPCTAAGISDAFRDAELLAEAVDEGLSGGRPLAQALADYERRRNEAAVPIYEFACQLAPLDPPTPDMLQLFGALPGNQEDTNRLFGLFAQTVPIPEFFAPENVERIIGASPGTSARLP
jgi:flavin-dependent dehydrogenase